MNQKESKIIGADGKPMVSVTLPTVKYKDFQFAIQLLQKEDIAQPVEGGYRPGDIVKEYRARCAELEDRNQILTAIVCTLIDKGPEAARDFLDSIGARVVDLDNKVLFEPKKPKK